MKVKTSRIDDTHVIILDMDMECKVLCKTESEILSPSYVSCGHIVGKQIFTKGASRIYFPFPYGYTAVNIETNGRTEKVVIPPLKKIEKEMFRISTKKASVRMDLQNDLFISVECPPDGSHLLLGTESEYVLATDIVFRYLSDEFYAPIDLIDCFGEGNKVAIYELVNTTNSPKQVLKNRVSNQVTVPPRGHIS